MTEASNTHDALREQAEVALANALNFNFVANQWAVPANTPNSRGLKDALDRIEAELHADGDFRDMLMRFRDDPIETILTEMLDDYFHFNPLNDWYTRDRPKLNDLHHCWILLRYFDNPANYCQDIIAEAAMRHSLCPMHLIDWAICFDDENPDCSQIRAIFPHSYDT